MNKFVAILFLLVLSQSMLGQNNLSYLKAMENKKADNYTEAIRNLKKAVEEEPTVILYKESLADALFYKKIYHEAIRQYIDLQSLGGNNNFYQLRLAESFNASNKFSEAIEAGKKISIGSLDKLNQSKYHNAIGNSYFKINYFPLALEEFQKMLALGEGNVEETNLKIARCYSELNSFDKAAPYFEKSISEKTMDAKRILEVGMNYYNADKVLQAISKYNQAASAGVKQDLGFNFNLANMYYEVKDYKNALEYCNKAKIQSPYDQDVASLIAYCHYSAGKTKDARAVIEQMLEVNPTNGDLLYLMGLTYQKDGKMEKAEKYFEQSFKSKPALEQLRVSMMKL
jgi:tetratricopeptide (TPR) repeat protein